MQNDSLFAFGDNALQNIHDLHYYPDCKFNFKCHMDLLNSTMSSRAIRNFKHQTRILVMIARQLSG